VIDTGAIDTLWELLGDAESVREMIDAFVEEVPARLAEARAGADAGDAATLGRAAHTLKSNALTFGATEMAGVARQIETDARAGDLGAAAAALPTLEGAWVSARPVLLEVRDRT
jgi:histidine phosphotransfer protein HptB